MTAAFPGGAPAGTGRRRFLGQFLMAFCAVPAAVGLSCALVPTYRPLTEGHRLRVPVGDLDAAFAGGDALLLQGDQLPEAIYLIRTEGVVARAVGSTCTHLGCQVRPARSFLRCPCHGSTYSLEGQVIRGPAPRPLTRYRLVVDQAFVEIELP